MLDFINSELGLFSLLAVGFALSVLKQWFSASQRGATVDLCFMYTYFTKHWVETVIALLGSIGLYVIALSTGQLNVLAALTCGYTGNSLADLLSGSKGTRSLHTGGPDVPSSP